MRELSTLRITDLTITSDRRSSTSVIKFPAAFNRQEVLLGLSLAVNIFVKTFKIIFKNVDPPCVPHLGLLPLTWGARGRPVEQGQVSMAQPAWSICCKDKLMDCCKHDGWPGNAREIIFLAFVA